MRRFFIRYVTLPNPLWYMVTAVIYLYRRLKRRIKQLLPERIRPDYVCEACGKSIGPRRYWGWCSEKCLRELCNIPTATYRLKEQINENR